MKFQTIILYLKEGDIMPTQDTIKLLNECNAGIKMAVESLDEVINKAKNEKLITLLKNSLEEHKKLGNLTHQKLNEFHDKDKEPSTIAKAMSWMSTNLKLLTGDVDEKIADIIIPNEIQGTLSAGKTEVVLSSEKISVDSTIDIYTDVYGVSPKTATVADGSITMTFKAQTKSVQVKVVVK